MLAADIRELLLRGGVIPAHPLALTEERKLDERRQAALTRYYLDAGAVGLAVGVHTTQFAIRRPGVGLLEPVLALAAETARSWTARPVILIAGICGKTDQACREAARARELGYHLGLLALRVSEADPGDDPVEHARTVAREIPLMGFYLQEAVGGRELPYDFWRRFFEIPHVAAVKVAPFDRYRTSVVLRALADSGRDDVALYTGNDDHIVLDLLTSYPFRSGRENSSSSGAPRLRFVGGLLGQWAVWTKRAVEITDAARRAALSGYAPAELLSVAAALTDANGAIFDFAHRFAGCIPGIHEILRRSGLLEGRWCLDPGEELSPGQLEEINRVWNAYPFLRDDDFVAERLSSYLA